MRNDPLLPTLILAVLPTLATAQPVTSFSELPQRLNVGDTVTVDRVDGTHTRGHLVRMTPGGLVVKTATDDIALASDQVRRITSCCDSLRNGALIGLAAGAVLGVAASRSIAENTPSYGWDLLAAGLLGGVGAGLGVGLDALIRTHKTVYQAPRVSARVSVAPGRPQVSVQLRW